MAKLLIKRRESGTLRPKMDWLCRLLNRSGGDQEGITPDGGGTPASRPGIPWSEIRLGLVLNGGGAKGAYQVGCLEALHAAGIRFVCVAGASVGALNAALIASGRPAAARTLWDGLDFKRVIGISRRNIFWLPLWAIFAGFMLRFGVPGGRHPDPIWRPIIVALGTLSTVGMLVAAYQYDVLAQLWVFILLGIVGLLSEVEVGSRVILSRMLTNNDPLQELLRASYTPADHQQLTMPLLVTLSRLRPWGDYSMNKGGWIPEYVLLNDCTYDDAFQVLLQSAGLPGVFPIRTVLGEDAVDGGFTDNSPCAPLLYSQHGQPLDGLFVIHLQSREESEIADSRENARAAWRASLLGQMEKGKAVELLRRDDMEALAALTPPVQPSIRIIELFPSSSLGDFLRGTLNFCPQKIAALQLLGRRDMERLLTQFELNYATADNDRS